MSSISSVGSSYNSYSSLYTSLSSGKKINSAADGAAESAIIQKETTEINALNVGSSNISQGKDALNIASGALNNVTDYLQSIRELAVQAGNGTLTADDKEAIQAQIDQYKSGIKDIVSNTNYNTKNLLDGSTGSMSIATGTGTVGVSLTDKSLYDALGIDDFDVTGKFDIKTIDNAIKTVNKLNGSTGSSMNALQYAYESNQNAAYNLTSALSRTEDTDYAEAISEMKKQNVLQQYRIFAQKKQAEQEQNTINTLF